MNIPILTYEELLKNESIFDAWNEQKKKIHREDGVQKFPKPREIWLTKMGVNIWDEQNGKEKFTRPVLILKKIGSLYFCIALSTKNKKSFFYKKLQTAHFIPWFEVAESVLIVSQAKNYDTKRFIKQIWRIEQEEFHEIKNLLKDIYF